MKFPKLFGKKKDEDLDEDDFEIEEIEDDVDDELDEALGKPQSGQRAPARDDEVQAQKANTEEMVGSDDEFQNPFDDVDEDDDDDEYEDDDDEEDAASDKKKAIIFAAVGFGVLLLSILGGAGWYFFSGSAAETATVHEKRPGSVELAMPAPPGSLNAGPGAPTLNASSENAPANPEQPAQQAAAAAEPATATTETPEPATEQTTFGTAPANTQSATSMNSLNNLNASEGTNSAGGGMVVPAVAGSAMARIADLPTAADQSQALSGAPIKALIEEKSGIGSLPKISNNGATPWQVYARPTDPGISQPKIALMIEGIGLSRQASLGAINKLPPEISMVLSPYARDLNDWVFRSRLAGHEVFVSLPMESEDFPLEDAGPLALDTRIQLAENQRRLDTVMASAGGYVGLVTHMGSRFMKAETQMRTLFKNFGQRGVMFVIGGNRSRNDALPIAKELKLVHVESDMYIDDVPRIQQIRTNLDRLESFARDRGSVLATARPYPVTIKNILDWVQTLKDKGIVLVPVSAIATVPEVTQ
ncbi:MAG: divergent polysaccharide deacetylase family protein [Rhodospirillales bacterium]